MSLSIVFFKGRLAKDPTVFDRDGRKIVYMTCFYNHPYRDNATNAWVERSVPVSVSVYSPFLIDKVMAFKKGDLLNITGELQPTKRKENPAEFELGVSAVRVERVDVAKSGTANSVHTSIDIHTLDDDDDVPF